MLVAGKAGLSDDEVILLKSLMERAQGSSDDSDWSHNVESRTTNVKHQIQEVQGDLRHLIKYFGPHVVCAGGAPRNWYFNKEARDYDYYILTPLVIHEGKESILRMLRSSLSALCGNSVNLKEISGKGNGNKCGYSDPHIKYVFRMEYCGTERDFIFLKWSAKACITGAGTEGMLPYATFVVDNFGCSISETAMYPVRSSRHSGDKYHFEFYRTDRFNRSVKDRTIKLRATSSQYKLKLQSYFKGWKFVQDGMKVSF